MQRALGHRIVLGLAMGMLLGPMACATKSKTPTAENPDTVEPMAEAPEEVAEVEKSMVNEVQAVDVSYIEQAEALWLERQDSEKLQQALQLYILEFQRSPSKMVGARLARGHFLLGDFHLISAEGVAMAYEQGVFWGEETLALNTEYVQLLKGPGGMEEAVQVLKAEDLDALYWTAANLSKWSRYKGFEAVLEHEAAIRAMMGQVTVLKPDYHHGAVNRFWGAFYAVAPVFVGGNLTKSKAYFDKALGESPGNLTTKVLMADTYATAALDRRTFERILNEVIDGDPTVIPELVPEFRLEQNKARELLNLADVLF